MIRYDGNQLSWSQSTDFWRFRLGSPLPLNHHDVHLIPKKRCHTHRFLSFFTFLLLRPNLYLNQLTITKAILILVLVLIKCLILNVIFWGGRFITSFFCYRELWYKSGWDFLKIFACVSLFLRGLTKKWHVSILEKGRERDKKRSRRKD